MAKVPYSPVPTVAPTEQATPNLSIPTPEAAFGGTVAKAIEGTGAQLEKVGGEIWQRAIALQELQNETEAKEADAQYMMKVGDLHAQFSALQGKDAVSAYPKYSQDIQALRVQMRDGLSNAAAQRMFDSQSLSTMGRTIFNGAGHAATQDKVQAFGASSARVSALQNQALQFPTDDVGFRSSVNQIRIEVQAQGDIHGWDQSQVDESASREVSKAWASRIVGLSRVAPFKAQAMLDENRERLHGADIDRVEKTVQGQVENTGARNISGQVNADLFGGGGEASAKSLQDRITEGLAKAKEAIPGYDKMEDGEKARINDAVRNRISSDWHQHQGAVKAQEQEYRNTISSALDGQFGGKVPNNVDELRALGPDVAAAWDALPGTQQHRYTREMASLAARKIKLDPIESHNQRLRFQGMAQTDPTEFLSKDFFFEKLNPDDRRVLDQMQKKMATNTAADPRVTRAVKILSDSGIFKLQDYNKDTINMYRGALQDALQLFQEDKKRQPDTEEVKKIGSQLMQQQPDEAGWFPWSSSKVYELEAPSKLKEQIKADYLAKTGTEPTDDQVNRAFVRQQYIKLYGGSAKKPDKVPDKPNFASAPDVGQE